MHENAGRATTGLELRVSRASINRVGNPCLMSEQALLIDHERMAVSKPLFGGSTSVIGREQSLGWDCLAIDLKLVIAAFYPEADHAGVIFCE